MLTHQVIKSIVTNVIKGQDYRNEIVDLINAEFLDFAISFFKEVVTAKLNSKDISEDWYRKTFLSKDLDKEKIVIHSGLNMKTVTNMKNSGTKIVCIEAANEHYEGLSSLINTLIEEDQEINLSLTIKFREVSVELNLNESLIVINTLAVKRSAIRGGLWSSAGKQAEKILMKTLCGLYQVPSQYFCQTNNPDSNREVDFFLTTTTGVRLRCEVKLMGKGNPESADAIFARESDIFIGDKLSDKVKQQCKELGVKWVELRNKNGVGFEDFGTILQDYQIPYTPFNKDLDTELSRILKEISI